MKPPRYPLVLVVVLAAAVSSLVTYQIARRPPVEISAPVSSPATRPAAPAQSVLDQAAADLARLTRENADLKAQLETSNASMIEHNVTLKLAKEQLEDLRRPMVADILSSALRAELKSGEVVVTGGYKLADGRRLYAFAKPIVQEIDGTKQVMIEGRYLTLTDEMGKSVGLDNLATNSNNSLQHGEVWVPAEEEAVFAKLKATPGTDVLAYPSLSLRLGRSGTISIGTIQLKVTPTLAEDGEELGLELRLEQPQQNADAAK